MPKTLPLPQIGSRFGRLTVVEVGLYMPPTKSQAAAGHAGNRAVLTRCDCGTEKLTRLYTMRSGRTLSCGCIKREQTLAWWSDPEYVAKQKERGRQIMTELWKDPEFAQQVSARTGEMAHQLWQDPEFAASMRESARQRWTIHGLARHPLYGTHTGMIRRCYIPTANGYKNYGGRGIRVFGGWHSAPEALLPMDAILGPRPPRATLDRIDNNGHYEPGNIQWATPEQQGLNRGHGVVLPIGGPPCNRGSGCFCGG
jgi:hypothetical protein